jgi:hypothetical protein
MLRVHVFVERTRSPFGRRTTMDTAVGNMFVAGALVVRKWHGALESRMAHHLMVLASI